MAPQSAITNYYLTQAGGGQFYAGTSYQKGYGIGSWLGGLFRMVLPILTSGAATVGREAARAGAHVLADVASGQNFKESARAHAGQAAENLGVMLKRKAADTMQGSGAIKRRKTSKAGHSVLTARRKKSSVVDNVW